MAQPERRSVRGKQAGAALCTSWHRPGTAQRQACPVCLGATVGTVVHLMPTLPTRSTARLSIFDSVSLNGAHQPGGPVEISSNCRALCCATAGGMRPPALQGVGAAAAVVGRIASSVQPNSALEFAYAGPLPVQHHKGLPACTCTTAHCSHVLPAQPAERCKPALTSRVHGTAQPGPGKALACP